MMADLITYMTPTIITRCATRPYGECSETPWRVMPGPVAERRGRGNLIRYCDDFRYYSRPQRKQQVRNSNVPVPWTHLHHAAKNIMCAKSLAHGKRNSQTSEGRPVRPTPQNQV